MVAALGGDVDVRGRRGEDVDAYVANVLALVEGAAAGHARRRRRPALRVIHDRHPDRLPDMLGGTEETTTGLLRLRALEAEGRLGVPGAGGQRGAAPSGCSTTTTAPASRRSTASCGRRTCCVAGKTFVVLGYGWTGKGIALRARGRGRAR